MEQWPEPWPMLWANYKKLPRTLDQCLLVPTILTTQAFWLNGRYTNEWNKRPNIAMLAVAPSTGSKDINSRNVLETIREIFMQQGKMNLFFSEILKYPESITSDTSFLKTFDESSNLFWLSTEATNIFQQMSNAKNNAAMKGLEMKLIQVVDGGQIYGKMKAQDRVSTIEDPNCQVLLYAQPETIREYLQDSIIDSGLLGRFVLHIPKIDLGDPFRDAFLRRKQEQTVLDKAFGKFFTQQQPKQSKKLILKPTDEDLQILQTWMQSTVKEMCDGEQHVKLLRRLAVSAEQLYTIILGTMRHWDMVNKKEEKRNNFDVRLLIPLLTYWAECKVYALDEYVDESIDPLADHIYEITAKLIAGQIKSPRYSSVIKKYRAVPHSEIDRVIQSRKKLIKLLDARNDMKNVRLRTNNMLQMWVHNGTMVEIENGTKRKLIGFTRDHPE